MRSSVSAQLPPSPDPFAALPAYPGGKRRLLAAIFGLVALGLPMAAWPRTTFADPFLGGASVSLQAKLLGFGLVRANDLSPRSTLVGRALLENEHVHLHPFSVLKLFEPAPQTTREAPSVLSRLSPLMRGFLANAHGHLRGGTFSGVEQDLMDLLVLKGLFGYFPMSLPSATDAPHVAAGAFDRVSAPRLRHYLHAQSHCKPAHLLRTASAINVAIRPGLAKVTERDAFAFLESAEADVVYLDPPYPGTQSYEHAFRLVDEFLGAPSLPPSGFSGSRPPLDELVDACRKVPVMVLSLNNSLMSADQIAALVARHRNVVRTVEVPFRHYGALATSAKNAANREILVLATVR